MKLGIVDYGVGNVCSVMNAVAAAGSEPIRLLHPEELAGVDRLILPGVGSAKFALSQLRRSGMAEALTEAVRRRGKPFLGICLGMQIIASRLCEHGDQEGLGWIKGEVVPISRIPGAARVVPHMGWAPVAVREAGNALFAGIRGRREFYFCHSYTLRDSREVAVAATVEHGVDLTAAICDSNVFATQFHPEKSQINGLQLIEAFLEWRP
jgi:glutamine amidotransferase